MRRIGAVLRGVLAALLLPAVVLGAEGKNDDKNAEPKEDPKILKCPDGWKAEVVLEKPDLLYPSVVCCAPDGRIFVAEDPMDMIGPGNKPGDRILCIFPDGHKTVFAERLYAVFGLQYIDGRLYVHHSPKFSVFRDDNGVGRDRVDWIDSDNMATWGDGHLNDHIPANFHLAMDGWLYMATGDKGIYGAVSNIDHSRVEIRGGGIVRMRPDGTNLEVYCRGTRNHLDVSLNAEDEMFTYDNTDDGLGWWTRFTHMVDGGYYGYPYAYRPFNEEVDALAKWKAEAEANKPKEPAKKDDEKSAKPKSKKDTPPNREHPHPYEPWTLWRIEEYGGGSPCGAIGYNEDALPEEYRGNLFHCEWGKKVVTRFVVQRDGATYKVVKKEDLLSNGGELRPVGITVAPDGLAFYVADWNYSGWTQKAKAGRLIKVSWTGPSGAARKPAWYVPAAMGKPFEASTGELIKALKHPAQSVRLVAQRRIIQRGGEAVEPLIALLNDESAPAYARWHAIWTLDGIDGGRGGREAILEALKDEKTDVSVRRQAAKELGERQVTEAVPALTAALDDADDAMRFRAATALGRIGTPEAVPPLLQRLTEKDLFTHFAVFTALNRIGKANPAAWPMIVQGLSSDVPDVREGAALAMRETYDEALVAALLSFASSPGNTPEARGAALGVIAGIEKTTKPWDGKWWGTQPVIRVAPYPKDVMWAGTEPLTAAIRSALKDSEEAVRLAAVRALQVAPDAAVGPILVEMFRGYSNGSGNGVAAGARKDILKALAAAKSPEAADLVSSILKDARADADLVPDSVRVAEGIASEPMRAALRDLAGQKVDGKLVVGALESLGRLRDGAAVNVATERLKDPDLKVAAAAAAALGEIGSNESLQALVSGMKDKRLEVRKDAANAIGAMLDFRRRFTGAPRPSSKTGDRQQRSRRFDTAVAIAALMEASRDKDLQKEAISALAGRPDIRALDAYLEGLGSRDGGVRSQSRKAVTAIAAEARPLIERRLDTNPLPTVAIDELQKIYTAYSPIVQWSVLGPLADSAKPPFDPAAPDVNSSEEFKGMADKPLKWTKAKGDSKEGMVDLARLLHPNTDVAAYAVATFDAESEHEVEFSAGADDTLALWLNGKKIFQDAESHSWSPRQFSPKAVVKKGHNVLVAKIGQKGGSWAFSVAMPGPRTGKIFQYDTKSLRPEAFATYAENHPGDPAKGKKLFSDPNGVGCIKCHKVADEGGDVGPSLAGIATKYDRKVLIESILFPSKQILDGYQQTLVRTARSNDVEAGIVRAETDTQLTLVDSAGKKIVIPKADIKSRKVSNISIMPEGLQTALKPEEFADLVAYLETLKK